MEIFTLEQGFDRTHIIIRFPRNGSHAKGYWIFIYDNPKMVSYYFFDGIHKKRFISKEDLLKKIKEFKKE
ncbi:MAG: hypothetical protein ACFFDN_00265 [Candidatus Hodarchaeota archaeon]